MAVLEVRGLTAGYGKVPVVNEVCFEAALSQVVAIVGPNGAGKSTTLKATFGLVLRHGGEILLDEQSIAALPTHILAREGLSYVPQIDNVFPSMSVEENLQLGSLMHKADFVERRDEVFELFPDLGRARGRRAGQLSGGQRNMLGMARGLMSDPKAMLLDEPTAGLSPANVDVVWSQIRRIAELGTSVLVVEQNVARALQHADRVYVLVGGRNYIDGSPASLAEVDLGAVFLGATPSAGSRPETPTPTPTPTSTSTSTSTPTPMTRTATPTVTSTTKKPGEA
ncbi:MAG: ABC transporter ATP-binding protein [Actinomycetota bacterium]|nr:ABC transporter ATP-binding protein [Actinomycetota bacterium]